MILIEKTPNEYAGIKKIRIVLEHIPRMLQAETGREKGLSRVEFCEHIDHPLEAVAKFLFAKQRAINKYVTTFK